MSRETLSQQLDRLSKAVKNHEDSATWTKQPYLYFGNVSISASSEGSAENHGYGGRTSFDLGDLYDDRESAKELATLLIKIKEKQYQKAKSELSAVLKKYMGDSE